ncbi:MAG: hypothetical protein H7320_15965 [Ferruginibacter sp.]|nr:hypothetical protein [Ferruginibacter sp.]
MLEFKKKIISYLSNFQEIITFCISNTEYQDDVAIYQRDYQFIQQFIDSLLLGKKHVDEIVHMILEPQTAKIFTDYWRQGRYGDIECKGFYKLCDEVRMLLPLTQE